MEEALGVLEWTTFSLKGTSISKEFFSFLFGEDFRLLKVVILSLFSFLVKEALAILSFVILKSNFFYRNNIDFLYSKSLWVSSLGWILAYLSL